MNALSVINLFPANKQERDTFTQLVLAEMEAGNNDPLEFEIGFKLIESLVKNVRENKEYKERISKAMPSDKQFSIKTHTCELQTRKTTKYDNDPEWCRMEAAKKGREAFLKALKTDQYDEATGELIAAVPYYTESTFIVIK